MVDQSKGKGKASGDDSSSQMELLDNDAVRECESIQVGGLQAKRSFY